MNIESFSGEYRFLSNFYPSQVEFEGLVFSTVEHAYQAAKTVNVDERLLVQKAETAAKAKQLGKVVALREDWDKVKLAVMEDLLRKKFRIQELRDKLLNTGDAELIEGNVWNDRYWGVCRGEGKNHLGRLLMQIRENIKAFGDV